MTDDVTDHPIDYRVHPDAYRVGRGEEGVFHVQPYKGELLPLWRFATMPEAEASIAALREKFAAYRAAGDFVGMDMTRKYLQMGYTRARRYANHRTGRKRDADGNSLPLAPDPAKAAIAARFHAAWREVAADAEYRRLKSRR